MKLGTLLSMVVLLGAVAIGGCKKDSGKKGEKWTKSTKKEAPKADKEAPKADKEAPEADKEAPKADKEVPKADKEAPKASDDRKVEAPAAKPNTEALTDPSLANETAPAKFKAKFETTKGEFVVEVTRDWAPNGADRFYNLVKIGFFQDVAFFRVIKGFMAQFGIHGDPKVSAAWRPARIKDEPVKEGNKRGRITFAMGGPDTRTTQLFISFKDNSRLDGMGFPSFGEVVSGMSVVDTIYDGYGEGAPRGAGPA